MSLRDDLELGRVRECPTCHEEWPPAASEELDVERVVQAVHNVAKRHGIAQDPPVETSVARIWGYSVDMPTMDAEIAAEYAALVSPSSEGGGS